MQGDIIESSSINGKLYFATGDITPTLIRSMGTVMGNLDLIEFMISRMFTLVDNHTWTLDKLKEIALDRRPAPTGQDSTATITSNVQYDNLFYSAGFKFVEVNSDGNNLALRRLGSERMIDWFQSARAFNDTQMWHCSQLTHFTSGDAVFHFGGLPTYRTT